MPASEATARFAAALSEVHAELDWQLLGELYLNRLDQPEAVHFAYCHKFEALIGSPEEHHERIRLGKKMLAVPEMYMHALSGKARQFHQGGLIEVDAYADPKILPLFGDGAIEVYSFGSSEPITFSRAAPSVKRVTANMGFFPPELNDLMRREIANAGPHGEEKAFPGHGKSRDDEITRLKRELAKVTEERDFLREAARYFAKESK